MKPNNSFGVCAALRCVIAHCYPGQVPLAYARLPLLCINNTNDTKDGGWRERYSHEEASDQAIAESRYDCASYEDPIDI
jgi:hypothetical protein